MRLVTRGVISLALAAFCLASAAAQTKDTFTGTASVKRGAVSASAPVSVTISKYATETDIETVRKAAKAGGSPALRKTLSALGDAGFIQVGERRTAIKFAANRSTGSGRLITILTAEPILYLGAGIPAAKPREGFDVGIAMLDLDQKGGKGELAPAAKVNIDDGGAIVIEDYGATVVWLADLARK